MWFRIRFCKFQIFTLPALFSCFRGGLGRHLKLDLRSNYLDLDTKFQLIMKFHGLDWQSNPKVTIQQSTKMDFQSKFNQKKDWIFGFFQIHNPILPTSDHTSLFCLITYPLKSTFILFSGENKMVWTLNLVLPLLICFTCHVIGDINVKVGENCPLCTSEASEHGKNIYNFEWEGEF